MEEHISLKGKGENEETGNSPKTPEKIKHKRVKRKPEGTLWIIISKHFKRDFSFYNKGSMS